MGSSSSTPLNNTLIFIEILPTSQGERFQFGCNNVGFDLMEICGRMVPFIGGFLGQFLVIAEVTVHGRINFFPSSILQVKKFLEYGKWAQNSKH